MRFDAETIRKKMKIGKHSNLEIRLECIYVVPWLPVGTIRGNHNIYTNKIHGTKSVMDSFLPRLKFI